jgi:hypothetical protein
MQELRHCGFVKMQGISIAGGSQRLRSSMMPASSVMRVLLLVLLGTSVAGCEAIGGIFKAGVWVGAIGVILVVVLLIFVVAKVKG